MLISLRVPFKYRPAYFYSETFPSLCAKKLATCETNFDEARMALQSPFLMAEIRCSWLHKPTSFIKNLLKLFCLRLKSFCCQMRFLRNVQLLNLASCDAVVDPTHHRFESHGLFSSPGNVSSKKSLE